MNRRIIPVFAVALCAIMLTSMDVFALKNGLARTPPMGFNTWNWFGCRNSSGHGYVTDTMLFQIANAMKSKGMFAVGYNYVNIDDCWAGTSRNTSGGLYHDSKFFPRGMKWFTDSIHRMGMKAGIYSDIGSETCASCYGTGGLPGMQGGYEQRDCDSFVAWGFDYLKLDFCCFNFEVPGKYPSQQASTIAAYVRARNALKAAVTRMKPTVPDAHEIVFSICNWGDFQPWLWGDTVGNLWRTTGDIGWQWTSMMGILDKNAPLYPYARIGAWNDPDMLEIGNGDFASNLARNRSHMSIWCIMASAMLAGNDIRNMSAGIQAIMCNKEAIDINQDTLGGDTTKGIIQGRRIISGNSEVWVKLLKGKVGSEYAVCFFNRGNTGAVNMSITTQQIAQVGGDIASGKRYLVRDIWAKSNLPEWTAGGNLSTSATVPVQDVIFLRLSLPTAVENVATVKVTDMNVKSEGERVVIRAVKPGPLSVKLVNLKGETVVSRSYVGQGDCSISTRAMPRGLYVVRVENATNRSEHKVFLK